jgi:hypothetical protein
VPGKALYSCLLDESAGVIDDLIVYFFTPTHFPHRGQRRHREQGHRLDAQAARGVTGGFAAELTQRRDGPDALAMIAVQGPNAREKFWAAFPATRAATEPLGIFQAAETRRLAGRPHRLHRRGRLRDQPAGGRGGQSLAEAARGRDQALRPRRTRHAAPRSRHEPLRPGHGRGHLAL